MSRLTSMNPEAIRAIFSQDSDETLITLVTIYDPVDNSVVARLADNYTKRILETADEVVYGVTSRSNDYTFLPIQISLPSEDDSGTPRCQLNIGDVTKYLTPIIRELSAPPKILIELVLSSTPDLIEVSFADFYINAITYNRDTVQCELAMNDYNTEPFPCYSFTPKFFPGLF